MTNQLFFLCLSVGLWVLSGGGWVGGQNTANNFSIQERDSKEYKPWEYKLCAWLYTDSETMRTWSVLGLEIWINNETYYSEPRLEADNPSILPSCPLSCQQLVSSASLKRHWDYLLTERENQTPRYLNHCRRWTVATSVQSSHWAELASKYTPRGPGHSTDELLQNFKVKLSV